jgi:glycosyltransferase involved in cell wall biosynthesis
VHFAGALHGESLAIHYASADLFLFPSLTETFGNVTLEALAAGLGVVAFDAAAAGELIRDGDNGLLAAPGDSNAFIDAACRALGPDIDLPRLRSRARESMLGAGWDAVLQTFERRLERIVFAAEVRDAALA